MVEWRKVEAALVAHIRNLTTWEMTETRDSGDKWANHVFGGELNLTTPAKALADELNGG